MFYSAPSLERVWLTVLRMYGTRRAGRYGLYFFVYFIPPLFYDIL